MMSQIVKQEGVFQAAFRLLQQRTEGNNPAWFVRLR
jgi:hypothetical protein